MKGAHDWMKEPDEGVYVAGIDVDGEDRPKPSEETERTNVTAP